jgi:hypothetical protein
VEGPPRHLPVRCRNIVCHGISSVYTIQGFSSLLKGLARPRTADPPPEVPGTGGGTRLVLTPGWPCLDIGLRGEGEKGNSGAVSINTCILPVIIFITEIFIRMNRERYIYRKTNLS